jgi:hypothetical protein
MHFGGLAVLLPLAAFALAGAKKDKYDDFDFFRWSDHAPPYTFLFGNHIDTHLETKLEVDGMDMGKLEGFFYVFFDQDGDGEVEFTADGLPIARHCTMPEHYDRCQVAWVVEATPCIQEINGCTAMFLYHQHDHPVWLIGPRLRTAMGGTFLGGTRAEIPQPGAPGHFHWLTEGSEDGHVLPSTLAELEAAYGVEIEVPEECNVAMASQLTSGVICPGYFMELAVIQPEPFAFHHGGEDIPLERGTDLRSHLNLATSYVAVDGPELPEAP